MYSLTIPMAQKPTPKYDLNSYRKKPTLVSFNVLSPDYRDYIYVRAGEKYGVKLKKQGRMESIIETDLDINLTDPIPDEYVKKIEEFRADEERRRKTGTR